MSISSIQNGIASLQRDIESLHRQISDESQKEAAKSGAIARALDAVSRAASASTLRSKQRELQTLERDRAAVQKKRADLSKRLSDKMSDLHKRQQELFREQEKEQRQSIDRLTRRDAQFRTDQDTKLRSLMTIPRSLPAFVTSSSPAYDAFISHATDDKDDLVRPLATQPISLGFSIWYDEFQLKVGDSLRRSIDRGLLASRFGIVVLSPSFFAKNWPQYELDGLVAKEGTGSKVILPLWHKVSKDEVLGYSPTLADKLALNTAMYSVVELAAELASVLRPDA
jgi:hypothetical protein